MNGRDIKSWTISRTSDFSNNKTNISMLRKTSIELVFLSYNQIAIYKTKNRIKEIQCKFLSLLQIDNMVFTIMT